MRSASFQVGRAPGLTCVPANGTPARRFAGPLPRRAVAGTHCWACSTRLDPWESLAACQNTNADTTTRSASPRSTSEDADPYCVKASKRLGNYFAQSSPLTSPVCRAIQEDSVEPGPPAGHDGADNGTRALWQMGTLAPFTAAEHEMPDTSGIHFQTEKAAMASTAPAPATMAMRRRTSLSSSGLPISCVKSQGSDLRQCFNDLADRSPQAAHGIASQEGGPRDRPVRRYLRRYLYPRYGYQRRDSNVPLARLMDEIAATLTERELVRAVERGSRDAASELFSDSGTPVT